MKNWKKILERLKYWDEVDRKCQKALEDYCAKIAGGSYAPIIEDQNCAMAFIEGLCGEDKDLEDDLAYLLYEVSQFPDNKRVEVGKDGITYDFKKEKEVIEYLEKNYK